MDGEPDESLVRRNSAEKAARVRAFNSITENLRQQVRSDTYIDADTQAIVLEALNATIDDFMSNLLDKPATYAGDSIENKIHIFFADRLTEQAMKRIASTEQRQALSAIIRNISSETGLQSGWTDWPSAEHPRKGVE